MRRNPEEKNVWRYGNETVRSIRGNTKQFGMKHTSAVCVGQMVWGQAASRNFKETAKDQIRNSAMVRIWTLP